MDFDWKATVASVAPGLATMLGSTILGPAGPLAGMATKAILGHFGIESTGDVDQDEVLAGQAVQNMTPADAIALKKVDAEVTKSLAQAGVDIFALEVKDRGGARDMRVKLGGDNISATLAIIIVLAWVAINIILFTQTEALPNKDILMRTLGTLDAGLLTVLYFFFGGSKGSQDKTRIDAGKK